jgi:hypothetical protein
MEIKYKLIKNEEGLIESDTFCPFYKAYNVKVGSVACDGCWDRKNRYENTGTVACNNSKKKMENENSQLK